MFGTLHRTLLSCSHCHTHGHHSSVCPLLPSEPTQRIPYIEHLIRSPRIDVLEKCPVIPIPQARLSNHRSAREHLESVLADHTNAVQRNWFARVHEDQIHTQTPLQVEVQGAKKRMCHDARYINSFVAPVKFRLETLQRDVSSVIRRGDLMIALDLISFIRLCAR